MATSPNSTTDRNSHLASQFSSTLFARSPEALLLIDVATEFVVESNVAARLLLGVDERQAIQHDCSDLFQVDLDHLTALRSVQVSVLGDSSDVDSKRRFVECDVLCEVNDGETATCVMVILRPIRDRDSAASSLQRQISERLTLREDSCQEPDQLRGLLNDLGAIAWEATLPFNGITYISKQLTSILGYSVDQWIQDPMSWENSIHPEDRQTTVSQCAVLTARGEDHRLEYRAKHAEGHTVWIEDRIGVIVNSDGVPVVLRGLMIDISARKEAEESVRRQRALYQLLVDNAPVCIHSIDASGCIDSINPSGLVMAGASSADEVLGVPYLDFVCDTERERIGKLLQQAYEGKTSDYQFKCVTKHGARFFKSNLIPILEPDGRVHKIIGTSEDITETQETLERLRIRQRAIDSTNTGILLVEIQESNCELIHCNSAFERITGFHLDQVVGSDGANLVIDDSGLTLGQLLNATMNSEQSECVVHRLAASDSKIQYNEIFVSPVRDHENELTHLVCFVNDITQRKLNERNLIQSEQRFRDLVESAPEAILIYDVDNDRFVDWNQNAIRIFAFADAEALHNASLSDLLPETQPDGCNSLEFAHSQLLRARTSDTIVFDMFHADTTGRQFLCEVRLARFPSSNQNLLRASLADVTSLRADQRKLTCVGLATEHSSDAMYVVTKSGKIVDVNQSACAQLGYTRAEFLTMNVWDVKGDFESEQWSDLWELIKEAQTHTSESIHVRKDGTPVCVEVSAAYANTDEELMVAIVRDITLRNQAAATLHEREWQMAQVSRQLVMGELVAGIAHEVNQPLYSINNFAKASGMRLETILQKLRTGATSKRDLIGADRLPTPVQTRLHDQLQEVVHWNTQVAQAATNAGSIIRRMANFVSKRNATMVPAKFDETILDAIKLLDHQIRHGKITLVTDLNASEITVPIDRVQIQQIIVNTVINSIEAIELSKSTRREISIRTWIEDTIVLLEVADSGPGFPAASQNNFFGAFASTKEGSMGMGLAVVHSIVESFEGGIHISKSQTGGAAILVSIPINREAANV